MQDCLLRALIVPAYLYRMPPSLFGADPQIGAAEPLQLPDAELYWYPVFLGIQRADALLHQLRDETPWRQDRIHMHGRTLPVPRLQAWYGSADARYGYSGILLDPLPLTSTLTALQQEVEQHCQQRFNSVLLNYYRDGNDSVSWHSDDEKELGPDPIIASLSLGGTRRFELRHRFRKELRKLVLDLSHGSLLLMGSGVQRNWLHQIPKQSAQQTPRLNLTFRLIG